MTKEQFIKDFSEELFDGNGVFFIGAGISVPSNLPDWSDLIKPFASSIGIDDLKDKDLPLVAQYIINENSCNRGPFINAISKRLRKKFTPNKYHEYISRTNVSTIWTTNYDKLLEDVFVNHIKDVKINDDSISRIVPGSQIEIIKMHGCIYNSPKDEIVITESDYEDFFLKRPATAQRLKMDLLKKSFLFIGYGYRDLNIKNIILEARRLAYNSTRQHYMVLKNTNEPDFKHWCDNLKRVGINVITIDEHSELNDILEKLSLQSRGSSVFVTGSHMDKSNPDAQQLGELLATEESLILLDGQSTGVMRNNAKAFMERCIEINSDIVKRLKIFPNPYAANQSFSNDSSLLPLLKQWRLPLLKSAQIVVAFDGGMGTLAEIEKAKELGCLVIPFSRTESTVKKCLDDNEICSKLDNIDQTYLQKARANQLQVHDVIEFIKKAIRH